MSILKLNNLSFSYDNKIQVLKDINYSFEKGKVYAIVGKSGAGKTTLLSLLSGLTSPTEGKIYYNDKDITKIDRYKYRSQYVGVIFQSFNLIPGYTALRNVMLSMDISGKKIENKKHYALEMLNKVEINEAEAKRKILKLSGGEQQRVAIARALSYNPDIILADEPTGNLDIGTQEEVINIFKRLANEEDKCIIIVTHSPEVAKNVDEIYELAPLNREEKKKK
ncbi:MAG: ABC transporter [Clostridiales bacterium]|nr:MAG: ABC transporter [Clostridiales bacterium]